MPHGEGDTENEDADIPPFLDEERSFFPLGALFSVSV